MRTRVRLVALAAGALFLPVAAGASEAPSTWPPPEYACHMDDATGEYFGFAVAPGAIDVGLVCHFYSTGVHRGQRGGVSIGPAAFLAGRFAFGGPYETCAELHVTYLDETRHWPCP